MAIRHLNKLFYPRSIAVVGASNREGDLGHLLMHNLLQGGFEGPIMPVSAGQQAIAGVLAYDCVEALPVTADLAVLCCPVADVPSMIERLGARGTRAAIVPTIAVSRLSDAHTRALHQAVAVAAKPFGMRVLGPNCLGLIVPHIGLNASAAPVPARTGSVAFVSQSSAMSTAVLDWARQRDIGFSHFVSLGDAADIDFADVIDFLGTDAMTRAILLYMEAVHDGRAFMSAGRGASRNKPVLVIKAGRTDQGQRLAGQRVRGALGSDDVYDAAIRRAGMLRVYSFGELFAAMETLSRAKPLKGDRLAVLTNGYGMAIMAADTLLTKGGRLAELSPGTLEKLAEVLPNDRPFSNPVGLATDAPPESYEAAARVLAGAAEVDALLVLHVPSALSSSTETADAIIRVAAQTRANVLTSWMGGETVTGARRRFAEAGIPTYDTTTLAIDAFLHMVRFRSNQDLLMETPPSTPLDFTPTTSAVRAIVDRAAGAVEQSLSDADACTLLSAYGIPTLETRIASSPEDAAEAAEALGFPVCLDIVAAAPGVRALRNGGSFVISRASVAPTAEAMLAKARALLPGANVEGIAVKRLPLRPNAVQARIRASVDPVFGPVIGFGEGGPAADLKGDRAVALPPLNMTLAREVISRSRLAPVLVGDDVHPACDWHALCLTLVKIAQLLIDTPEISDLDINPLLVDAEGVMAVDVSVRIAPAGAGAERRLAIRPYPRELEEEYVLPSGQRVLLRPIRPEDEPEHHEFLSRVSIEDLRYRFFGTVRRLPHVEMAKLTQIDYDREMAFIATVPKADGPGRETLGVVRTVTDPNNETAEYAILVRSDLKGQRLGWKLMDKMVRYCRSRGTRQIVGQVLRDNGRMLDLVHGMGFKSRILPDDGITEVTLTL